MRSALAALAGVAVLIGASSAEAAQRYAAPMGSGSACTQSAPCSLQEAVGKVGNNDEVIVTGGTYTVSAPIYVSSASNVYIHGDLTAPMPHIVATVEGSPFQFLAGTNERYGYLDISNEAIQATGLVCYGSTSRVERVRVLAIGEYAHDVVEASTCIVRDSLLRSDGKNSVALEAVGGATSTPESATARNVTAVAKGIESFGILCDNLNPVGGGSMTLDLKNAIASGDGSDVAAAGSGPSHLVVTNSNFDSAKPIGESTITGSANQAAPPLFVNAGAGDYREAPGSPTIDAGSTDQIGALDLEGNPRNQGAAPDIGAFELAPPPAPVTVTRIEALSVKPRVFRAVNAGGAIVSRTHKGKVPVGATVSFTLSSAVTVDFGVERAMKGRRVGRKCAKQTRSNRGRKVCTLFRKLNGAFTVNGAVGANRFAFSGRLNSKALKPGSYRLVGRAGDSTGQAPFEVVH